MGFGKLATGASLLTAVGAVSAAELNVDFDGNVGEVRPALHSSGWTPRSSVRFIQNDDAAIRAMNLTYARTHDWALVNSGQRVVDYQYIFPLFDKDPKDPSNYYFEATDHLLSLARAVGQKIFYRLGTSIEHSDGVHFNARVPRDFDKTAEIFAATIRHYNKGWANGHDWNIEYWEIWNEPDMINSMWCLPAAEGGADPVVMRDLFVRFFVTVLKRLKSEFPEVKVGGPAMCSYKDDYFDCLLKACKEAGVAPDFISWHAYESDPKYLVATAEKARRHCDGFGFTKTELILNEYHYILSWDGIHGRNSTPAMVKRALDGPTGHNAIDAACFYLTALSLFHVSPLTQAYWYGCSPMGNWGYMDQYKQFNKPCYAARLFGGIVKDYKRLCGVTEQGTLTTFAVRSEDGRKAALLVTDYRGTDQVIEVKVKGLDDDVRASAVVLDHTRDNFPCDVAWRNGKLRLVKPDKNSAAWLITFEED